jgi:DNA-binding beta-propeller fold protein YncE
VRKGAWALIVTVVLPAAVFPGYEYEGEWTSFIRYIATAPNGNVYGTEGSEHQVLYYDSTGSFLGQWGEWGVRKGRFWNPLDIDVASNGRVYVCDWQNFRIQYFTPTGSFLGKWGSEGTGNNEFTFPRLISIGLGNAVYVLDGTPTQCIKYFTATGSFLGKWDLDYVEYPSGLGVSPLTGRVYVADRDRDRIVYYSSTGSLMGEWGYSGNRPGQFDEPTGVAVARDGRVFVVDQANDRIQFFTSSGSIIGIIAEMGNFNLPVDVAVSWTGARFYVKDGHYSRIKYFKRNTPAVEPTSLGRVKALFE